MTHYENYAPVSNQAGIQNIYGNVIIDGNGDSYERFRADNDGSITEKVFDQNILASLAFPQMLDRRSNVESAHQDTCQWLFDLDEYQLWKQKPRGLLWIKGKPGSGKSTLMSHLHRALSLEPQTEDLQPVNLEFFFSARGAVLQHTFVGMLRSLLNQIFVQDSEVRQYLRSAYKEKYSSFGGRVTTWQWQLSELQRLFIDTMMASAQQRQLTLLIDALDEAGEEAAKEIAIYFHSINDRLTESAGMARICISCRHYPIASSVKAVEIYVEDHNHDDIDAYVRDHIIEKVYVDDIKQDLSDVYHVLVDQAMGVFQWVRLIVPMVTKWLGEGETTSQILINLSEIPKDLAAIYKYILTHVMDPKYRHNTLRLFQWTCLAQRPLSAFELQCVIELEDVEIIQSHDRRPGGSHSKASTADSNILGSNVSRQIMTWSGGLIEAVPHQKVARNGKSEKSSSSDWADYTIQVIHQSVKDFMVTQGLSYLLTLSKDEFESVPSLSPPSDLTTAVHKSHGILYLSCLKYLCVVRPDKSIPDSSYEISCRYPFLNYAICYGLQHGGMAGDHRALQLEDETQILRRTVPMWIFACGLTNGCFSEDPPQIRTGTTVLHLASIANLTTQVEYRIRRGDDANKTDSTGWSPMHLAALYGHLSMVKLLYQKRASIHRQTMDGDTPLLLAAHKGNVDVFAFLATCGASLEAANLHTETVLYAAAFRGSLAICRLCIEAGVDVNAQGGFFGNALQAAAGRGDSVMVQLLIDADADVNAEGGNYGNALQAAVYVHSEETASLLLQAGAHINAQGGHFGNALQAASWQGCEHMTHQLLNSGAKVNAQGGHFGNALQAAVYQNNEAVISLLLNAGADITTQGGHYGNALQAAAFVGNVELINSFLEAGIDVNTQGGHFGNALQAATCRGHQEVIRILLEAGANVNARGGRYGTALHAAYCRSGRDVINMLVAAGAEPVEPGTNDGDTRALLDTSGDNQSASRAVSDGPDCTAEDHSSAVAVGLDRPSDSAGTVASAGSWVLHTLGRFFQ